MPAIFIQVDGNWDAVMRMDVIRENISKCLRKERLTNNHGIESKQKEGTRVWTLLIDL
jgi:hypothetical protein